MKDLFGNEIDEFVSAKERYGIWPVTVWDCDMSSTDTMRLKEQIGDDADYTAEGFRVRQNLNSLQTTGKNSCYGKPGSTVHVSVFNPAIAAWILNLYAPKKGVCFDPFAGGGTRAIMAAKHGLVYLGYELREEEVAAVRERCDKCGVHGSVQIYKGDSRRCDSIGDSLADFSFTCPPYFNLEQYNGGPDDLSMAPTYLHFCAGMTAVLHELIRILKHGALAVWVVGLLRDTRGELIPLNHDITRLAKSVGFRFKEEIVLAHRNNGAIQRVGNIEKGNKFLIRTHEYALVFEKP